MHYKRWLRTGTPARAERPRSCAVDGCDRDVKTRGWCHGHYQRWYRHGDVRADIPLRAAGPCEIPSCGRQRYARGLCATHYKRMLATGDARAEEPIRSPGADGWVNHGYLVVCVPPEDRWLSYGETQMAEHRLVMARLLERPLEPDENVHHRNGDRQDNRAQNLELWTTSQPSGQRLDDKLHHALELLRRYRPGALRADLR